MTANTRIQWCDHTFNPWIGCTKVSPGCDNCYAEAMMDKRLGRVKWGGMPSLTSEEYWRQPMKWDWDAREKGIRAKVFCASLADVFDNNVPVHWRWRLFELIGSTTHLDWLILTKRIGNAHAMLNQAACCAVDDVPGMNSWDKRGPWKNVWLGATVVNQEEADRDIPKLLATPAAIRFLSIEPMLGPIDLTRIHIPSCMPRNTLRNDGCAIHAKGHCLGDCEWILPAIDWVIVGGESGPNARPLEIEWARDIRMQCDAAGVAFFTKQLGGHPDKRGELEGFPDILRVREFPRL